MTKIMLMTNTLGLSAIHFVCIQNKLSYLKLLVELATENLSNMGDAGDSSGVNSILSPRNIDV